MACCTATSSCNPAPTWLEATGSICSPRPICCTRRISALTLPVSVRLCGSIGYLCSERACSTEAEAAEKDDLGQDDDQEDGADDGVEAEEGKVDPVEAAAAGNPMFQHEAAHNDQPADKVGDAEFAEQPKGEQESAHHQVSHESGLQGVLRSQIGRAHV